MADSIYQSTLSDADNLNGESTTWSLKRKLTNVSYEPLSKTTRIAYNTEVENLDVTTTFMGEPAAYFDGVTSNIQTQINNITAGIEADNWKQTCWAGTTAALTIASPGSIQGLNQSSSPSLTGKRILVKNQASSAENGIYIYDTDVTPLVRSSDTSTAAELEFAKVALSSNDPTMSGYIWYESLAIATLGTSPVTFINISTGVPLDSIAPINLGTAVTNSLAIRIGTGAGGATQGNNAIAIGKTAGTTSQGVNALAIGINSGVTSQGTQGIAIGALAGNASQGTNATAIGTNAGNASQGANSIAIGNAAGITSQATEAIAIGTNAGAASQGASAIAIGNGAGSANTVVSAVSIGTDAGKVNISGADPGSVCIGLNAGKAFTGGGSTGLVAIGPNAGAASISAQRCTFIGKSAGAVNIANTNTAIGNEALLLLSGSGSGSASNTVIGNLAMSAHTTGSRNTAVGNSAFAGSTASACDDNVAIGSSALAVVGVGADQNTAVGSSAGVAVTTGDNNTFLGYLAGSGVTSGSFNTIIGTTGATSTVTGSNNLVFNISANGSGITSGSRNIAIGAVVPTPTGNDQLIIGNGNGLTTMFADMATGNVAIGTTTPVTSTKLTVVSPTGGGALVQFSGDAVGAGAQLKLGNGTAVTGYSIATGSCQGGVSVGDCLAILRGASTEVARFTSTSLGIGTTSPGALLDLGLAGTTRGVLRLANTSSGNVTIQAPATGTWSMTLPTNDGDAGQTLVTDGSGVTSWSARPAVMFSVNAGVVTIQFQTNVTSVTRTSAGVFDIVLTGLTNNAYIITGTAIVSGGLRVVAAQASRTTTTCTITTVNAAAAAADPDNCELLFTRTT